MPWHLPESDGSVSGALVPGMLLGRAADGGHPAGQGFPRHAAAVAPASDLHTLTQGLCLFYAQKGHNL